MRIRINQTISNTMDENRNLIRSITSETYILIPSEGKKLKNIKNGRVVDGIIALGSNELREDYEEVDE